MALTGLNIISIFKCKANCKCHHRSVHMCSGSYILETATESKFSVTLGMFYLIAGKFGKFTFSKSLAGKSLANEYTSQ